MFIALSWFSCVATVWAEMAVDTTASGLFWMACAKPAW
jgi:hypothetical protein